MAMARIAVAILLSAMAMFGSGLSADPPRAAPQLPSKFDHADSFSLGSAKQWAPDYVSCLVFSPDDRRLASGALDGYLRMWDVETQEQLWAVEAHRKETEPRYRHEYGPEDNGVYGIAFAPDGKTVATAGSDAAIRIWRVSDGELLQTLEGHERLSICVAYSPDGRTLASGDVKGTIRIWNLGEGKAAHKISAHTNGVTALAFWKNGEVLISGGYTHVTIAQPRNGSWFTYISDNIMLWDVKSGKSLTQLPIRASNLAMTRDETVLACGGIDCFHDPTGKRVGSQRIEPEGCTYGHCGRVEVVEFPSGKPFLTKEDDDLCNHLVLAARSRHVIYGFRSMLLSQGGGGGHRAYEFSIQRIGEDSKQKIDRIPLPTVHRKDRDLNGVLVPTAMAISSGAETLAWGTYKGDVFIQPLSPQKSANSPIRLNTEEPSISAWKHRFIPSFNRLEDRLAPALIITVNSTGDADNRDQVLTLREAIKVSNGTLAVNQLMPVEQAQVVNDPNETVNTIKFNLPGQGVQTIAIGNAAALPDITTKVKIDGGLAAAPPTLRLDGANAPNGAAGLRVKAGESIIWSLQIVNFSGNGIELVKNGKNEILHCYIGTDGSAAMGNKNGILIESDENAVGVIPAHVAHFNLISGNRESGVLISGGDKNKILGNRVGTNAGGSAAVANERDGIRVTSGGGSDAKENLIAENVISGNKHGVYLQHHTTVDTRIIGNFIGTTLDVDAALPNDAGVMIASAVKTQVGDIEVLPNGQIQRLGNVIAGNNGSGVVVGGVDSTGNKIQANWIGQSKTGLALPNGHHAVMVVDAQNTTVGKKGDTAEDKKRDSLITHYKDKSPIFQNADVGTERGNHTEVTPVPRPGGGALPVAPSVASYDSVDSNTGDPATGGGDVLPTGILITGEDSTNNAIYGSFIGVDEFGLPLDSFLPGIVIDNLATNTIIGTTNLFGRNIIAFNGDTAGVVVLSGTGHTIRGNSIHHNAGMGIDLGGDGRTPNDYLDLDAGPNNLQNFPELTSAMVVGGNIDVSGTLHSSPNTQFYIDFYGNMVGVAQEAQGEFYLGTIIVWTDPNGNASFQTMLLGQFGNYLTATATHYVLGDTSEFSDAIYIVGGFGGFSGLMSGGGESSFSASSSESKEASYSALDKIFEMESAALGRLVFALERARPELVPDRASGDEAESSDSALANAYAMLLSFTHDSTREEASEAFAKLSREEQAAIDALFAELFEPMESLLGVEDGKSFVTSGI